MAEAVPIPAPVAAATLEPEVDEMVAREPPAGMTAREKMMFRKQEKQRIEDLKIKRQHDVAIREQMESRAVCTAKTMDEFHGQK